MSVTVVLADALSSGQKVLEYARGTARLKFIGLAEPGSIGKTVGLAGRAGPDNDVIVYSMVGKDLPAASKGARAIIDIAETRKTMSHLEAAAAAGMAIIISSDCLIADQEESLRALSKRVPIYLIGNYPGQAIESVALIGDRWASRKMEPGIYSPFRPL